MAHAVPIENAEAALSKPDNRHPHNWRMVASVDLHTPFKTYHLFSRQGVGPPTDTIRTYGWELHPHDSVLQTDA